MASSSPNRHKTISRLQPKGQPIISNCTAFGGRVSSNIRQKIADARQEIVPPMNISRTYLASLLIAVTVWGYAYEASFFIAAGLSTDQLSVHHYFASGGQTVAFMLGILLIWNQLGKFFTKQIHQDDSKALQEHFEMRDF